MSAIFGVCGDFDRGLLREMAARLGHRGECTRFLSPGPGVILGCVGTAEPSAAEIRPGVTVVADATLYDREEETGESLAGCWSGSRFDGLGDLNGDFAFAVWDDGSRTLALARDPLGVRTLHYWASQDVVLFASEYKALLADPRLTPTVDRGALAHLHRSKYLPDGRTLLAGVRSVPAGTWIAFRDLREVQRVRYFTVASRPGGRSLAEAEEELRQRFLRAVARRAAVSPDSRLGAELSGGIDSAAVVAAISRARPGERVRTWTIGSGPADPEIRAARIVAEHFGTDHHEVFAGPEALAPILPRLVWHLEDPIARTETALYFFLMQDAAREISVVLGGYASDGLFAGMPKHKLLRMMQLAPIGAGGIREFYNYTQFSTPPRTLMGRALHRLYFGAGEPRTPRVIGYEEPAAPGDLDGDRSQLLSRALDRGIMLGVPAWMPKVEKLHAAHGVEFRSPFTDPEVVRLATELPDGFKLHRFKEKYVLRRALAALLPREIVSRPKFPARMDYGLRLSEALDEMADNWLAPETVRSRGFFAPEEIQSLRSRHAGKAYGGNHAMRLWSLLLTELWARTYLDARGAPPDAGTPPAVESR